MNALLLYMSRVVRGTYGQYIFKIDGITLAVEDFHGNVRVSYLSAPETKNLMELPKGTEPDPGVPVTREELAGMLKLDSGSDFAPAEIRIIPTAFSSNINGGAHVNVGGDPINAASWKFTLVFASDGKIIYYCRGK